MTAKLILYPLPHIVFPTEKLPLHVSEPIYQDLVDYCHVSDIAIGVPILKENKFEYGTQVRVEKLVERHSSGALDVILKGSRVFELLSVFPQEDTDPYTTAEVAFLDNIDNGTKQLRKQYTDLVREFYFQLELPPPSLNTGQINSFTISHKIGLTLDQEFYLLTLKSEKERLSFLINHLIITIPILQEVNQAKLNIELNGHFRKFDPLDFEDYNL